MQVTSPETAVVTLLDRHELGDAAVIIEPVFSASVPLRDGDGADDSTMPGNSSREHAPNFTVRRCADAHFYPASMIKVPLAVATADALARGILTNDALPVHARHMTANDAPSPLIEHFRARPRELLELMVSFSDNIATNMLLDAVGRAEATRALVRYGMRDTQLTRYVSGSLPRLDDPRAEGENRHSPADAARLMRRLAEHDVPEAELLYAALERQHWNAKLAAGLRPGDTFAHKTGDTSEVSHDGGILTTPEGRRYVIILYTNCPSNDATDARCAAWMRDVRAWL